MRYIHTSAFALPGAIALALALGLAADQPYLLLAGIAAGVVQIAFVSVKEIRQGNWSLDYIALLAMALAAGTHEWLAGAVIALMYTGGEALEEYASRRAKSSLAALLARIPKTAVVRGADGRVTDVPLPDVTPGTRILVRGGELVPLDGMLLSSEALLNLANLTGEPLPEVVSEGTFIRSGSVNAGETLELSVSGTLETSTYAKIVDLVRRGAEDQAPFVRLAERANLPFTVLTLLIALAAFAGTGDIVRVLAVLVIATPCPLIIAAPVAFVGGLSRAAGKNIIVKRAAALEIVAGVTTVFFDKTGTLTLGEPELARIEVLDASLTEQQVLSLAASLEFHSIHPLARALVAEARARGFTPTPARKVTEMLGTGIAGIVGEHYMALEQAPHERRDPAGISLALLSEGAPIALFHFADVLKEHARQLLTDLAARDLTVAILTGDRREHAERIFDGHDHITIYADLAPEEKYAIVENARKRGERVAMVGDGLNDAPALAKADVGIVFSGTENSAAIEAADIAILGHDPRLVTELFGIAKRSVRVADESVYAGIVLSIIGQIIAAFGFIVPVEGAVLQEGIDVAVILNALRAAF